MYDGGTQEADQASSGDDVGGGGGRERMNRTDNRVKHRLCWPHEVSCGYGFRQVGRRSADPKL